MKITTISLMLFLSAGCQRNGDTAITSLDSQSTTARAASDLLWDGDASKGTGVFKDLHTTAGSTISVVNDPTLGQKVFRFLAVSSGGSSDRAEGSHAGNLTMENNKTYYFGWKQKYGSPLPNPLSTDWVNVFQWKANPALPGFNYPVVIRADSDNLRVIRQKPDESVETVWALGSLPVNTWVSWVLAIHTSSDPAQGYVEVWYNGVHKAKQFMKTFDSNSRVDPKWGIYRTGRIDANAQTYLWRPRCGTTYASVAP